MGRDCKQLLATGHDLLSGKACIDVVWVDSLLEFPAAQESSQAEPDVAAMSCLLVNMSPTDRSAERFALLAASMRGVRVRHQRFVGDDQVEGLAAELLARNDDFLSAVVLLDSEPEAADVAQRMIDALRPGSSDTTGLVVAVSTDTRAVADVNGFDGFVTAAEGSVAQVASQLFMALASRTAPFVWSCLDDEDIQPSLGSATDPSRLVEAIWLDERKKLVFTAARDEQTFRQSTNVAAFIFAHDATIGATKSAVKALRSIALEAQSLVYLVPVNFLVDSTVVRCTVPLVLICSA